MIYLLIARSCAENYPPASICNMVLKTQYFFSKVKRLSKSSSRHMRKNVQPFAGEYGAGGPPAERQNRRRTICQQTGRWQQTTLGLWLARNFHPKQKPQGLCREHSLQRTESPQFPETLNFFMFFHTCFKFPLFSSMF
jgi:hypothetical protein